jgi:site-specific DNA recombinase
MHAQRQLRPSAEKWAVIYCRVSHSKQRNEGDGLHSQEHRCREYAGARGYAVEAVFHDDVSGGGDFMSRPGMVAMLRFLSRPTRDDYVVIFDDLKRFARDTEFHIGLRKKLATYNATVECLNFKFEDTPEGKFIETIIAAQGELERLQGRRQTIQKMKARVEHGFYVFKVPVGYRYEKSDGKGKVLVRNEPLASIVQEALEGFASGRFQIQAEVKRFFESRPEFPKAASESVRNENVANILRRSVYGGFVEAPNWGVTLRKGHHEPLVSGETYQKIQERLTEGVRLPARKDLNLDFPLRGFVLCGDCRAPITACWSTGRWKDRYPYYLCAKRGCAHYGKSIKRQVLEGEFGELLERLTPSQKLFRAARAMFEDVWNHRLANTNTQVQAHKTELIVIERKVEQFLDRIADADVPSVVKTYEDRIRKLEVEKAALNEKITRCGQPARGFDEKLRTALEFLANPCKLWGSPRLEDRRTVLKLAFAGRISYLRNEGFRTPNFSFPFRFLADVSAGRIEVASPRGFEPRFSP